MKKVILLIGSMLLALGMYAQVPGQVLSFAVDSTVDTGDETFTSQVIRQNGVLTIQVLCTQTVATSAGQVYIQESLNGTNWVTMTFSNSSIQAVTNDTLTVTNGAVEIWNIPVTYGYKYRLFANGSGSGHTSYTVKMLFKPNAVPQRDGVSKAWTAQVAADTQTKYFTTSLIPSGGILSLQVVGTQASGTTAGTAYVQESLDGTSWKTLSVSANTIQGMSSVAGAMSATTAVATNTNGSVAIWHIPVVYAAYYRIVVAQTGTSSTSYAACRLLK